MLGYFGTLLLGGLVLVLLSAIKILKEYELAAKGRQAAFERYGRALMNQRYEALFLELGGGTNA